MMNAEIRERTVAVTILSIWSGMRITWMSPSEVNVSCTMVMYIAVVDDMSISLR